MIDAGFVEKLLRTLPGITESRLAEARAEAGSTGRALEEVATARGLVGRQELYELAAQELNVPYVDVSNYAPEPELLGLLPPETARRLSVLPLFRVGDTLTVALENPADINVLDELRQLLRLAVSPALADPQSLKKALAAHYPAQERPEQLARAAADAAEDSASVRALDDARCLEELATEAPVVRLVNELLENALLQGASDIHVEPEEDVLLVRTRVDGVLRETARYPARLHAAVVSRIKILSGLDISERRKPQDGRFEVRLTGRTTDARVSTFPTVFGENLVIRLLDKSSGIPTIHQLGMDEATASRFESDIHRPNGIILVTGPTGSGKTTTLYAALNVLNSVEKNIITLEDPVEYRLPLVRHCQINPKAGVTFATGLRSILRQDPDVIMVGEIRDSETAQIAFQAALTGHLVLSTLHTNDAASALTRLADMGVEPFLISSSVLAILAQRLVRRNCDKCTIPEQVSSIVLQRLGTSHRDGFSRGTGCPHCGQTRYRGRVGIYELLTITSEIREMVMSGRSSEEIKAKAIAQSMRTLRFNALDKARAGLTSAEEALRVTPND